MANQLVSVIIPTYNRAQYICDAIDSVLAQTYKNIEIIVVVDGSIDNTRDILSRYGSKINYVFQKNAGPSAARNNGIRRSSGTLLAFLDSDDIWLPEKLERQVELIEQSQDIGLVNCGFYITDVSGEIITEQIITKNYKSKRTFLKELMVRNIVRGGGSGSLIRRECFDKLGVFNEDIWLGEDRDMWLRIAKHYEIKFVENPLIKCRMHGTNLNKDTSRIEIDGKKVVARNIERWHFLLRRKAYSHIYMVLAWELMDAGNKNMALVNILKSITAYPLKTCDGDSKYKTFCKLVLPSCLFNFFRKFL